MAEALEGERHAADLARLQDIDEDKDAKPDGCKGERPLHELHEDAVAPRTEQRRPRRNPPFAGAVGEARLGLFGLRRRNQRNPARRQSWTCRMPRGMAGASSGFTTNRQVTFGIESFI